MIQTLRYITSFRDRENNSLFMLRAFESKVANPLYPYIICMKFFGQKFVE